MTTSPSSPTLQVPPPECLIFPAKKEHTATAILLHGLGDSANFFAMAFDSLKNDADLEHVKFIFPSAHKMVVTGNRNSIMPSWFDLYSFDLLEREEDEKGLFRAVGWVKDIIEKEEREHNIPAERIVVGGFSQGGALAMMTALTMEKPIAGLLALSTYIPLRNKIAELATGSARMTPILWCHGTEDKAVKYKDWKSLAKVMAGQVSLPFIKTKDSAKLVATQDERVLHFRGYSGMGHWIEEAEVKDVGRWMTMCVR